jgi:hypothetical protein
LLGALIYAHSTLHGGATQTPAELCVLPGGLQVCLLGESFRPYRAMVRIERD